MEVSFDAIVGVFRVIYQRILQDPRRTLNPDEATLFFIPYDSGIDATMNRVRVCLPCMLLSLKISSYIDRKDKDTWVSSRARGVWYLFCGVS